MLPHRASFFKYGETFTFRKTYQVEVRSAPPKLQIRQRSMQNILDKSPYYITCTSTGEIDSTDLGENDALDAFWILLLNNSAKFLH